MPTVDERIIEFSKVKILPFFAAACALEAIALWLLIQAVVNRALSAWKDLTSPRPVARSGVPVTGV